jgi:hypothetical protein
LRASLLSESGEILLAGFERVHFGSGRAFRIHSEPDRPDGDTDHAGGDILRDLGVVLLGELFGLEIVGLDLGADHGAIALPILWLDDGDRMRVASGTGGQNKGKGQSYQAKLPATHDRIPSAQAHSNVHEVHEMFYTTISRVATIFRLWLQESVPLLRSWVAVNRSEIGQWTRNPT